ncbi:MAG: 1,3-beta-galactosyl-N-acetylhexosamine phosphorylase C-terminal domain-containing protein [Chthoniobacterales bacterium]
MNNSGTQQTTKVWDANNKPITLSIKAHDITILDLKL